ncbi:protein translocase subunit SecF [Kordiimonas pumila]|uniref:Protein-export membrane protein SecF n=1 Tax=Kordiimonas pumila TaxID=2161677 RepID=A0ABV7D3A7_9PROT|nr:protein translocase subunit SecF [Kordiimonas pumila]
MLLHLIPEQTNIKFLSKSRFFIGASALLILASIALFAIEGLNLGIDFKGGITLEVGMEDKPVPLADVREALGGLGLGDVSVKRFGSDREVLIRIERQQGDDAAQSDVMTHVRAELIKAIPDLHFRQSNIIGPVVSEELARDGTIAVSVAVFMVLIYIWLRFEWQFGVGAVIALVHDVLLTVGFFSITRLEFNLTIIAALLTIVGYSLNDTVVVYDRIRENIRKFRKKDMADIIDMSLNQTLNRTIMTSFTTLIALLALFFLGGEVIRGFTAAMIWGVVVGTYSSIFIASPLLTTFNMRAETLLREDDKDDPTVDKSRPTPFDQM